MTIALDILSLQAIDDEAAALRNALAEVERRLAGDEELLSARAAFGEAEARARDVRQRQLKLEGEVQALSDKVTREEKRLYDGSVKNAKELVSLQQEIDSLRAHRGTFEDQLIAVLDEAERAAAERKASSRQLAGLEARRESHLVELRAEARRLQGAILQADARREAARARIPARPLSTYEDLRKRRGGAAVARVSGGNCGGCRVGLPDAIRRRAMSPVDVVQCPNCERILVVG